MARLLIDGPVLMLSTYLANVIGVNEALFLQQLNYLSTSNFGLEVDGKRWIRNSLEDWRDHNFTFWSDSTIKRIIARLLSLGAIQTRSDINKDPCDRTSWYAVDYDFINNIDDKKISNSIRSNRPNALGQVDPLHQVNLTESLQGNQEKEYKEKDKDNILFANAHNSARVRTLLIDPSEEEPLGKSQQTLENSPSTRLAAKTYGDNFEAFWGALSQSWRNCGCAPGSKSEAAKEFKRLAPTKDITSDLIRLGEAQANARSHSIHQSPNAFVAQLQHLCRWLKNRRWEDEIDSSGNKIQAQPEVVALVDQQETEGERYLRERAEYLKQQQLSENKRKNGEIK